MYNYHCLNAISNVGLAEFSSEYAAVDQMDQAQVVLVRSAAMHEMDMPAGLDAIARAGAGVNNIPLDKCAQAGVVVFNTPGANANAVKELVLTGMLVATRNVIEAANWVQTIKNEEGVAALVEKGKKSFVGHEITGKTLGVIGMGAIGFKVAQSAVALGMKVVGYDACPLCEDRIAMLPDGCTIVGSLDDVYAASDFITVHVPLLDSTKEMFNQTSFAKMKDGVIILNYSRDKLVCEPDMKEALASGKVGRYVTDFPNDVTAGMEGVIAIPHLGASTEEAEDNCAAMAVQQVRAFLEDGNIINSVNYPGLVKERQGACRICVLFQGASVKNEVVAAATAAGATVLGAAEAIRNDFGYCIVDCDACVCSSKITVEHALKVRIIK